MSPDDANERKRKPTKIPEKLSSKDGGNPNGCIVWRSGIRRLGV
jgi:hypothetical protein